MAESSVAVDQNDHRRDIRWMPKVVNTAMFIFAESAVRTGMRGRML